MQGNQHAEQYEAKHESSLIYEGGTLSYDPNVYGGKFQDRYHIKTLQVSLYMPHPRASPSCATCRALSYPELWVPCRPHEPVTFVIALPNEVERQARIVEQNVQAIKSCLA